METVSDTTRRMNWKNAEETHADIKRTRLPLFNQSTLSSMKLNYCLSVDDYLKYALTPDLTSKL